ncbi:MAG: allantoin degradation transcriptional regulator AllR [Acidimicrobiia bacterium]|nr:MAG: allantoin degradation transcriptional regulator AllR [Acidimicrobiia bacterium]
MNSVQSLERAFAIIDVIATEPCGLSEAARRVGLPKSTVARLMATLETVGALERVGARYHPGPAVTRRSGADNTRLIALARPYLEELAADNGEVAGVSIADGDRVHAIAQVDVDRPVQARDWTGELASIHSVPSGLIMMAEWPEDRLAAYLDRPLQPSTAKTLVDADRIRTRLDGIRAQGYAWGKEEFHEGINSVAAPVRDHNGTVVAAVHLHGPAFRFPEAGTEEAIGRDLAAAADRLSSSYATAREAPS